MCSTNVAAFTQSTFLFGFWFPSMMVVVVEMTMVRDEKYYRVGNDKVKIKKKILIEQFKP